MLNAQCSMHNKSLDCSTTRTLDRSIARSPLPSPLSPLPSPLFPLPSSPIPVPRSTFHLLRAAGAHLKSFFPQFIALVCLILIIFADCKQKITYKTKITQNLCKTRKNYYKMLPHSSP